MMSETKMEPAGLGDRVHDVVTKFEGIVVGMTNWMHGCDRLTVEPESLDEDGQPQSKQTFDSHRIEVVERGVITPAPSRTNDIPLGSKVKERVTGFEGVATGRTLWLSGNEDYIIEPDKLDEKGQPGMVQGYEGHRLTVIKEQPVPVAASADKTKPGGPQRGEYAMRNR
jgi:hypothetical protein